jgi:hypothetical protein
MLRNSAYTHLNGVGRSTSLCLFLCITVLRSRRYPQYPVDGYRFRPGSYPVSRHSRSIPANLIKNGCLQFSWVRDLDMSAVPDRDCTAICQSSERPTDSLQRNAHIGADIGTLHWQIYFLRASPVRVLVGFEHLKEQANPSYRTIPAKESSMASSLMKFVGQLANQVKFELGITAQTRVDGSH